MISRITAALAARYKAIQEKEKGFTLIELLVVVIIIGVLAAIAIPIYIGVQDNAKNSAVKSDLTNIKIALIAAYTEDSTFALPATPTPATAVGSKTLGDFGAVSSATYTTPPTTSGTIDDFCIDATGETGGIFSITSAGGVEDGACP